MRDARVIEPEDGAAWVGEGVGIMGDQDVLAVKIGEDMLVAFGQKR